MPFYFSLIFVYCFQPTLAFFDVKGALQKDPANYEASAMDESLQKKAEFCKDYVRK